MVFNFSKLNRGTLIGRIARWPLSLIPTETRIPIMQGTLKGQRWIVGSSNHGCWLGSYERAQQLVVERVTKKGDVFFDIGAHVGFYTLLASLIVGGKGRVVAFEPIPENLHYLKQHLELNSIGNVDIVEAAVSDRTGNHSLSRGPSSSMWHFEAQGDLNVRTVSLDELLSDGRIPPPNVIKMDIEGAESLALAGAAKLVNELHPVIILSTHGSNAHQSCCNYLRSAGYRLFPIGAASIDECSELLAVFDNTD